MKKRILSLLLAVVLMFSALPFSVSADEITIRDSSGDVPVLYAQDPFNTVKSEVEGGTNYMTSVGVTREAIVRELESHEDDDFYLGTKYVGGDAQSPNGDTSYNSGKVGMNCAGFISYVLRKAGLDAETTMEIMHQTPVSQFGSGLPYDWLAGASNYKNLIENGNISAYAFRTKQELLSSGLAEKGDIILMWWSNSPGADGADNHIGFFWGEASDDDVMWHSGTEPSSGNQISEITPKTPGSFYILIKIEPLQPKEYTVTLTKTSADVSITQGNSAYSLAGATYNVYEGKAVTHCHHCGKPMVRRVDSRSEKPVTWKCSACGYFLPLPDEDFKRRVFLLQQRLADKPLLAEKEEGEIPVASMEARRLTNEIYRRLDSGNFSEDELVTLALQCAAENYQAIASTQHITERITAALLHAGPLSAFDRTLFERTVSEIHLTRKGEIILKLQNGVFIGEGDSP